MELNRDERCLPNENQWQQAGMKALYCIPLQDQQVITDQTSETRDGKGLHLLMKLVILSDKFGQTFCWTCLEIHGVYHINALHVEYTAKGHICNY